jgi:hypothetical protein
MCPVYKIALFLVFVSGTLTAQVPANLDKFYSLIDKSAAETIKSKAKKDNKVYIEFTSPADLAVLKNSLIDKASLYSAVVQQKEKSDFVFSYSVVEAKVKYGECFTKSFLGRNYVEREVALKGFAGINNRLDDSFGSGSFEYSVKDTVEYRQIKELGNPSYPFTNPEAPAEPFFSSILEPFIAIGVAVTTVYLLFTVRSK